MCYIKFRSLLSIIMQDQITEKLLDYQVSHVENLERILNTSRAALDASDTGTGKTYTTIALCKKLGLKPLIICPKSVINNWIDVIDYFEADYYGIANYELIKNCRYYPDGTLTERAYCPFITRRLKSSKTKRKEYVYTWKLPDDIILVFDEAHKCKNRISINSELLVTCGSHDSKILLLSATIADKPDCFLVAGYILGLYHNLRDGLHWMEMNGKKYDNVMQGVNNKLYPDYASRMKISELGPVFPDSDTMAKCYNTKNRKEIQEQYALIEEQMAELKRKEIMSRGFGVIIRARMRIELLKAPIMIKLAKRYIRRNQAVAIFVNYCDTLNLIAQELDTNCVIQGQQSLEQRAINISRFQNDESRVIICNIQSGGVGISLHDTHGNYPRVSIISPSWSAIDVMQALGRINRANTRTRVKQRIVYCKDTVEEGICENMKDKLINIGCINDGDSKSVHTEGLTIETIDRIEKTELEQVIDRLETLGAKKARLHQEMAAVEDELRECNNRLNQLL